jgi:hypothetical protein
MTGNTPAHRAFDADVLQQLAEDLESPVDAYAFALSFQSLLPARIQRIDHALRIQDREETLTALLSLQASTAMVGACQLNASVTRALAHHPVEKTLPGPLRRKLEGQADLFKRAFAEVHARTTPGAQELPAEKCG